MLLSKRFDRLQEIFEPQLQNAVVRTDGIRSVSYSYRLYKDFSAGGDIIRSKQISKDIIEAILPVDHNGIVEILTIRLYLSADNLYTFTRFSGADPEVRLEGSGSSLAGTFSDNYPVPRSFVLGVDLKF